MGLGVSGLGAGAQGRRNRTVWRCGAQGEGDKCEGR